MATVLPFVVRPRTSTSVRVDAGDASIIIFPGVRYEKPTGPASGGRPTTADGTPRKRKGKTR